VNRIFLCWMLYRVYMRFLWRFVCAPRSVPYAVIQRAFSCLMSLWCTDFWYNSPYSFGFRQNEIRSFDHVIKYRVISMSGSSFLLFCLIEMYKIWLIFVWLLPFSEIYRIRRCRILDRYCRCLIFVGLFLDKVLKRFEGLQNFAFLLYKAHFRPSWVVVNVRTYLAFPLIHSPSVHMFA